MKCDSFSFKFTNLLDLFDDVSFITSLQFLSLIMESIWIPAEVQDFSLLQNLQNAFIVQQASYSLATRVLWPGMKA